MTLDIYCQLESGETYLGEYCLRSVGIEKLVFSSARTRSSLTSFNPLGLTASDEAQFLILKINLISHSIFLLLRTLEFRQSNDSQV